MNCDKICLELISVCNISRLILKWKMVIGLMMTLNLYYPLWNAMYFSIRFDSFLCVSQRLTVCERETLPFFRCAQPTPVLAFARCCCRCCCCQLCYSLQWLLRQRLSRCLTLELACRLLQSDFAWVVGPLCEIRSRAMSESPRAVAVIATQSQWQYAPMEKTHTKNEIEPVSRALNALLPFKFVTRSLSGRLLCVFEHKSGCCRYRSRSRCR